MSVWRAKHRRTREENKTRRGSWCNLCRGGLTASVCFTYVCRCFSHPLACLPVRCLTACLSQYRKEENIKRLKSRRKTTERRSGNGGSRAHEVSKNLFCFPKSASWLLFRFKAVENLFSFSSAAREFFHEINGGHKLRELCVYKARAPNAEKVMRLHKWKSRAKRAWAIDSSSISSSGSFHKFEILIIKSDNIHLDRS